MKCIRRYKKNINENFDLIILGIQKNKIKCGKYADRVKIDTDKKIKGNILFQLEDDNDVKSEHSTK